MILSNGTFGQEPKTLLEVIDFYNKTKGGVDCADHMIETFSNKFSTRRWPVVLFCDLLEFAALNAYVLHEKLKFDTVAERRRWSCSSRQRPFPNFSRNSRRFPTVAVSNFKFSWRTFVCLVFNGTSTQDMSICANCGRVKPTQLAKDGQRDTMHNSQYVTQGNTVHNKTLQFQKCNNRLSNRKTYLFKYYVSAFTNTKSDHTLPIRYNNFTRWDAVLRHAELCRGGVPNMNTCCQLAGIGAVYMSLQ